MVQSYVKVCIGYVELGPLNITFESDMPIRLLHLILINKIQYVENSDMKNVRSECDVQRSRLITYMAWHFLSKILN